VSDGPEAPINTCSFSLPCPRNKSADHDVVPALDEPPGADISQNLNCRRIEIEDGRPKPTPGGFDFSSHDGGVSARIQGNNDGRLEVIARLKHGAFDFALLVALPVSFIVMSEPSPARNSSNRVGERVRHPEITERRSDRANNKRSWNRCR
jgi:hypothetical protein